MAADDWKSWLAHSLIASLMVLGFAPIVGAWEGAHIATAYYTFREFEQLSIKMRKLRRAEMGWTKIPGELKRTVHWVGVVGDALFPAIASNLLAWSLVSRGFPWAS
jgi:hypothetical protein